MATPSSREELKQYCLRTLGSPVIEINVDDDQLEDRIDEGIQFFQEYHFDGIERMYHIHKITASELKITSSSGNFSDGEQIIGATSNAKATIISSNSSIITFKNHYDSTGIANNNVSSSFSSSETIEGQKSGVTATVSSDSGYLLFGDLDNHYIPLTDSITGIVGIFDIQDSGGGQISSSMFSFRYQFHLNELPYLTSTSIINYSLSMQHIQLLNDIFVGKKPLRFNRHQNRLYLDIDWDNDLSKDQYVVVDAFRIVDPETFTDVYNDMFLKRYVTALFKRQWGANLIKYQGVALPGGITLDGRQLFDDAINELRDIEENMSLKYELPIDFMVGPG
jgi:hypothetical protein